MIADELLQRSGVGSAAKDGPQSASGVERGFGVGPQRRQPRAGLRRMAAVGIDLQKHAIGLGGVCLLRETPRDVVRGGRTRHETERIAGIAA